LFFPRGRERERVETLVIHFKSFPRASQDDPLHDLVGDAQRTARISRRHLIGGL